MNKEDFFKNLENNAVYKAALNSVKTDAQRNAVAAVTQEFMSSILDAILPVVETYKRDPEEFIKKLEELEEKDVILNASGSSPPMTTDGKQSD